MCRVNRLIYALPAAAVAALALSPLTAAATASPSPSLDQVLAAAPSGYTELTTGGLHGQFTAHDWAITNATGSDATETENTLNHDGFVDGYGKLWAQAAASHALFEAVMAFSGGQGAHRALTAFEVSTKAEQGYKHPDTLSGIDTYYGAHVVDPSSGAIVDEFNFVKGNDVFFVALGSQKDDVLQLATTQAKAQFDSAPESTIPTSQWPENASGSSGSGFPAAGLGAIIGIIVAVVAVIVFLARRRATPTPMMVGAGAVGGIQLSQDGNFWWDGQTWRDASREVPPTAQRSSDGTLWWDGRTWRPVPTQTEQPGPPPTT